MQKKTNKQFMILSVIGIIIMVCCHFSRKIYKYIDFFPFIAIFVFISGYFYKEENEENIGKYIWKRFKKLMIPFFAFNLIYGVLNTILRNNNVIYYGSDITFYNFLIQPFINNNQYVFNFTAWFVPTIFVTNICYIVIHKYAKKARINEYILLSIMIIFQMVTVYFCEIAKSQTLIVCLFKVVFFLPFLQIGFMYNHKWQKYEEKIPTIPYLICLWGFNCFLSKKVGDLIYDIHDFSNFINYLPFLPIITSMTSILFFARISKVLEKYIGENRIVNYIGNHTFAIMTHHVFLLFVFDWILYAINPPFFDVEGFRRGWMYIYRVPGWDILLNIAYLILGLFGPLILQLVYDKIKSFKCFDKIREI